MLCVISDLEWKIIYVGSAESEEYDQVLDSVLVGPVPAGRHMFVFQVSKCLSGLTISLSNKPGNVDNISYCIPDLKMETLTSYYYFVFPLSFQADAPNTGLIPESDAVGVTVVLITCTYQGQEFIRVGYYVNNEYTDPELRENPPLKPDYTKVMHSL